MRSTKLNDNEVAEVLPIIEKLIGDTWLEVENIKGIMKSLFNSELYNIYKVELDNYYDKLQGLEKIYSWINNKELLVIEREEN